MGKYSTAMSIKEKLQHQDGWELEHYEQWVAPNWRRRVSNLVRYRMFHPIMNNASESIKGGRRVRKSSIWIGSFPKKTPSIQLLFSLIKEAQILSANDCQHPPSPSRNKTRTNRISAPSVVLTRETKSRSQNDQHKIQNKWETPLY